MRDADGRELTLFTGEMDADADITIAEQIYNAGVPELLFKAFPGRIEYHSRGTTDACTRICFGGSSRSTTPMPCSPRRDTAT